MTRDSDGSALAPRRNAGSARKGDSAGRVSGIALRKYLLAAYLGYVAGFLWIAAPPAWELGLKIGASL